MSEEQRFRWVERLFWDLNLLPQMGQSGTPGAAGGGGRGAGALSSLSSKHLQMEIILILLPYLDFTWIRKNSPGVVEL